MSKNKMTVFILAVIMIFSMGCAKAKINEPIENIEKKSNSPVTFTTFIDHSWFWTDKFAGKIAEEITKKTGVTLNITKATDNNQLPVMIASGDYSDIIYSSRLFDQLGNSTVSYDWNTLIKKYAQGFLINPVEIANSTMPDGKFYTILNAYSPPADWQDERVLPSPGTPNMSIRADIMDKLGNPPINNTDDFIKVLGMVKSKFPDMTPHIIDWSGNYDRYWSNTFGVELGSSGVYATKDSKIELYIRQPAYVDTLKFLNSLTRNGYMPVESLIYKQEQYGQEVANGKAFSFVRATTDSQGATADFVKAGLSEYKAVPIQKVLSNKATAINDGIGWSGTFITKKCKNPERAIQFMDYMKSEEGQRLSTWGIEGVHYNIGSDRYPTRTQAGRDAMSSDGYKNICIGVWTFGMSAKTEGLWNYDPSRPEITNALLAWKKVQQFKPEYYFLKPSSDSDEKAIYTKVMALIEKERIKIIATKSDAEFDAAYSNFIKSAESLGLKKLESSMTDKYNNEVKKKYVK